jgi:hypothetical protein
METGVKAMQELSPLLLCKHKGKLKLLTQYNTVIHFAVATVRKQTRKGTGRYLESYQTIWFCASHNQCWRDLFTTVWLDWHWVVVLQVPPFMHASGDRNFDIKVWIHPTRLCAIYWPYFATGETVEYVVPHVLIEWVGVPCNSIWDEAGIRPYVCHKMKLRKKVSRFPADNENDAWCFDIPCTVARSTVMNSNTTFRWNFWLS